MARIRRWDRELAGPRAKLGAWTNMLLVDHGIFRLAYQNLGRVGEASGGGELWRSAQPSPGQIARFARAGGRTVINLRGGREHGSWPLERDACRAHGLVLADFVLRSREAPSREAMKAIGPFLDGLAYPALVHCKSGADRAGLFSALFLLLRAGAPVSVARGELGLRYGHFRHAKTGILDAFLDAFEAEGEKRGLSFAAWIEGVYDPEKLTASFRPRVWSTLLADRLIRRE